MPELLLAIGAAAHLPGNDATIPLGPLDPAAHGGMRLRVEVDGSGDDAVITAADPQPGLLHRGAEKLLEVRDYRQGLALADRHDWMSSLTSEIGLALAVEGLLGLQVPERATWIRTLLAEIGRAAGGLAHAGSVLGAHALTHGPRERLISALEPITGGRVHHSFARIGGVAHDLTVADLHSLGEACRAVLAVVPMLLSRVEAAGLGGIAVLSREDAVAYGVSGPVARGSGLDLDLRRDDPMLAYPHLGGVLRVSTRSAGDARARAEVLIEEIGTSLELALACVDHLAVMGDGPVDVPLPKVVRAPEGAGYVWLESASGINGYYLVSTAEKVPWRCRIRTASFNNVQALSAALPGTRVGDVATALTSFCFVMGDVDK